MTCGSCNATASRIKVFDGHEVCEHCGGFSATGGATNIHKTLIRQRNRHDMLKHEGDTLNPWAYDKHSKSFKPNEEFVKRHSETADSYYEEGDLNHLPGLKKKVSKLKQAKAEHSQKLDQSVQFGQGDVGAKQKEILNEPKGRKVN